MHPYITADVVKSLLTHFCFAFNAFLRLNARRWEIYGHGLEEKLGEKRQLHLNVARQRHPGSAVVRDRRVGGEKNLDMNLCFPLGDLAETSVLAPNDRKAPGGGV